MKHARGRERRRGLTLIELMLVMGLLALVLGAGLGSLASLDAGQRAALGLVQNVVRTAHNTAVARRAPARVRIDPTSGSIAAHGSEVVGTWHFEDEELSGAGGFDGVAVGFDGATSEDGFLGRALDLADAPRGARVEVAVQDDPIYDPAEGFVIELAARLAWPAAGRILSLGGVIVLEVTADGALRGSFRRRTFDSFGAAGTGGPIFAQSRSGVLVPGRWTRIALRYDRRVLGLAVDGVPVAVAFSEEPVAPLAGPLELGGGREGFPGALDELTIALVTGEERATLPPTVHFAASVPRAIEFLAGGALDPLHHQEPVTLALEFDDGRVEQVVVSLYGTVE